MLQWLISQFGIIGFFIAAFISNTIIPLPFELLLLAMSASRHGLPLVILIASIGATLGEITIYFLGRGGHKIADRYYDWLHRLSNRIRKKFEMKAKRKKSLRLLAKHSSAKVFRRMLRKYGWYALFLGAFTPLPMFLFGLVAGYYKYEFRMFTSAVFLGKFFRYFVIISTGTALKNIFF